MKNMAQPKSMALWNRRKRNPLGLSEQRKHELVRNHHVKSYYILIDLYSFSCRAVSISKTLCPYPLAESMAGDFTVRMEAFIHTNTFSYSQRTFNRENENGTHEKTAWLLASIYIFCRFFFLFSFFIKILIWSTDTLNNKYIKMCRISTVFISFIFHCLWLARFLSQFGSVCVLCTCTAWCSIVFYSARSMRIHSM